MINGEKEDKDSDLRKLGISKAQNTLQRRREGKHNDAAVYIKKLN